MTLQQLAGNFSLDVQRIDKLKSKTPEGTQGYLHLCNEQSAVILKRAPLPKVYLAFRG